MIGGPLLGAILLAASGGVVYHLAARSIPKDLPPALVLAVAYGTALVISAMAYVALPPMAGAAASLRAVHPAVVGLGVGAAMIELGYVMAYRAAGPISATSVIVNGLVAVLLVPLGVALFQEHLTTARMAGLLLCLAGVWLLKG